MTAKIFLMFHSPKNYYFGIPKFNEGYRGLALISKLEKYLQRYGLMCLKLLPLTRYLNITRYISELCNNHLTYHCTPKHLRK